MGSNENNSFDWSAQQTRSVASVLSNYADGDMGYRQVNIKCMELCAKLLEKLTNFVPGASVRIPSATAGLKSKTTVPNIVHFHTILHIYRSGYKRVLQTESCCRLELCSVAPK